MTGKYSKKRVAILVCIITALFITSCNMLRPTAPKEEEGKKKKNPPKALTQLEKETDGIIQDLEEVQEKRARQLREMQNPSKERIPEEEQQQGESQQQSQNQQGQEGEDNQQKGQDGDIEVQGQQQSQQQGQQQEEKQEQPEQKTQPMPEPDWNNLESVAESLNEQWNNFEPAAKADGAMIETIKKFNEQLITLTEQIMARNEENTMVAAITLYSYYPDFLKLYSHNQPPEIKELRGLTRKIIILGQQDKWDETKPHLEKMKKAWQEAKTKMKKPDDMLNKRIDAALSDFRFVVSEKKINMARIKGNILIKNLDQVE